MEHDEKAERPYVKLEVADCAEILEPFVESFGDAVSLRLDLWFPSSSLWWSVLELVTLWSCRRRDALVVSQNSLCRSAELTVFIVILCSPSFLCFSVCFSLSLLSSLSLSCTLLSAFSFNSF
mmetsp:Transcript_18760/g.56217  ORF Transcript_18760/g.56217 Transcript_18760/m.56217 type:complete len:122 (-) Transcript_18760:964-1329(-)